ncbi:MAG: glutamate--tRNA ligase [Cytophagales bacterium]|nr:glutamate--tRNA ligase [Cytophagales bacterium]
MENVRVRFAPSPTGALHIGGVRTALFNYLFARKNRGTFILRIEDTDQNRFVDGAESYIKEALNWCGLIPDESSEIGGDYGPYKQSERKEIYQQHVQHLLDSDHAYYAFDTPEELDEMREKLKETKATNQQYNSVTRMSMKNSLTLSVEEVEEHIKSRQPYVIRMKIPLKEEVRIHDIIRGWIVVHSSTLDDKVLMKSDGFPTYHLANIVDDHLMKITHVIRGEEWLPSVPSHVLLYRFLGWEDTMPKFAHLPLILKPDGNGKLSKRAADKAGFPIFPLNWKDPQTNDLSQGFKEEGYLPEALINFLSLLGWNPGTEQEIFSLKELEDAFSLEQVNKAGTKFDIDKIRWFNEQYIRSLDSGLLANQLIANLEKIGHVCEKESAVAIVELLKDRITFPSDLTDLSLIFFEEPIFFDEKVVRKKLTAETNNALSLFAKVMSEKDALSAEEIRKLFSITLNDAGINPGSVMQMLRVCLSGGSSGPDLMGVMQILTPKKSSERILHSLDQVKHLIKD